MRSFVLFGPSSTTVNGFRPVFLQPSQLTLALLWCLTSKIALQDRERLFGSFFFSDRLFL